jgi:hypothetical protein
MTTKERIHAELETLAEEEMNILLHVIQEFSQGKTASPSPNSPAFLSRLKQIQIDGPEDFSVNLDQYLNGENRLGSPEDLH